MDNYAAHSRPAVRAWLAAHPRITVHFTPTSASWMNLVEVWFSDHRTPGHPPRQLPQRPRPHYQDPGLHRRLERPPPPVHLDQDRRPDPHQSQPSEDFRNAALERPGSDHDAADKWQCVGEAIPVRHDAIVAQLKPIWMDASEAGSV
jgi:hypothetical protein